MSDYEPPTRSLNKALFLWEQWHWGGQAPSIYMIQHILVVKGVNVKHASHFLHDKSIRYDDDHLVRLSASEFCWVMPQN